MPDILVVDDDLNICRVLGEFLERSGFNVESADGFDGAVELMEKTDFDMVITDLKMPGKSGIDLLKYCGERNPSTPVVVITGHGTIEVAVASIKKGAFDFITKPIDETELLNVVRKGLLESEMNRALISSYFDDEKSFLPGFIGETDAIQDILKTVRKIAPVEPTVLITGETGVGKELIARAIHLASFRRENPFVKVNCAAIPENLIESELFGYEKGAFTGAAAAKPGRFEIAHEGTVFLDEIGEMPLHLQAKLLTVIQDRAFERVGGVKTIRVDIRFIAATNRDLKSALESGEFRSDLFYRLNVVPINIPPLRDRMDDLIPQVAFFLNKFTKKYEKTVTGIAPEVIAAFNGYSWPGNTRELENTMERMVIMAEGETIGVDHLPEELRGEYLETPGTSMKEKMEGIARMTEKQMIMEALNKTDQNRTEAAKILGVSRRTLQNKIKEYNL